MKRRYFLIGSSAVAVSGLLSGCNNQQAVLKVQLLKNSIPVQLLNQFRKGLDRSAKLDFGLETQMGELFAQLQAWQEKPQANDWWSKLPIPFINNKRAIPVGDLVALGDYWLAEAIKQKLIQPLDSKHLSQWDKLPQKWQNLARRNDQGELDPKGKVWGAPYRWGSTVIVYRRDKFESNGWKPPTDWADLWRDELRDRISLLDQPREVIGLTLKKLGLSYNTQPLDQILPKLKQELLALQKQVKFYSSTTYLQPLILGDTYVAVGWSTDVLPAMQRYPNITAVVPESGTALWTDLWVKPFGANSNQELVENWIDFCWQPEIASLLSRFTQAASPILAGNNRGDLPDTKKNQVLLPKAEIIQKSEFLLPVSQKTLQQYQTLWKEMRVV